MIPPTRRPIDLLRESAGSMLVGGDDDQNPVTGFVKVDDELLVMKDKAVYRIRLADQVDPKRLNPNVPNSQQRVLHYGSADPIVQKTILTAYPLIDNNFVVDAVDKKRAVGATFAALQHLALMSDTASDLANGERRIIDGYRGDVSKERGFASPALGNVEPRCKAFLQNGNQVLLRLLDVVRSFYGKRAAKERFDSLLELSVARFGKEDDFSKFVAAALPFLRFVTNARHCVDHETRDQRIVVTDFALSPEAIVVPPTIEVIHPQTPESLSPLVVKI